jgi:NAD(P)H-dependent flavin oxidoreductase YrpB (nitropropane dioxygenase family)
MHTLLQKIGVSLPIIQAPMAGVSTPEMAAAVSNAGGLGSIGLGAVNVRATTFFASGSIDTTSASLLSTFRVCAETFRS